jgi:dTDP-4-dehydrorhamnose 3,5-epimerase
VRAEPTDLPGVVVVHSPVYGDDRGFFTEVFHEVRFRALGLPTHFAQDSHSRSMGGVLRGLHYQLENPQGKLVRAVSGAIFDVAVDIRRSSPHFREWVGVRLDSGDGKQLWIPPGFAHGFLVLSDSAHVTYKCTTVYHPESNRSIRWNDDTIAVRWPCEPDRAPILSQKDAGAPPLSVDICYE